MKNRSIPLAAVWWPAVVPTLMLVQLLVTPTDAGSLNADLLEAAERGRVELTKSLLTRGADANVRGKIGLTPLMLAAWGGHARVVELHLRRGAHLQASADGRTALHLAAERGLSHVVRLLLDKGADVHWQTHSGRTALIEAAERGHLKIVTLLEEHGANYTLGAAARVGDLSRVQLLLREGADLDALHSGLTPLMHACLGGRGKVVRLL
ncbi:MAG: ankyrin repeat domain-containing protein, partial [Pseudomonadota bacterium]